MQLQMAVTAQHNTLLDFLNDIVERKKPLNHLTDFASLAVWIHVMEHENAYLCFIAEPASALAFEAIRILLAQTTVFSSAFSIRATNYCGKRIVPSVDPLKLRTTIAAVVFNELCFPRRERNQLLFFPTAFASAHSEILSYVFCVTWTRNLNVSEKMPSVQPREGLDTLDNTNVVDGRLTRFLKPLEVAS
jgi:hypothetical protein